MKFVISLQPIKHFPTQDFSSKYSIHSLRQTPSPQKIASSLPSPQPQFKNLSFWYFYKILDGSLRDAIMYT